MSRSGYSEDCENLAMWRGIIASASRGKRGQAFFRDLIAALDAMSQKRLIPNELRTGGEVCALGALASAKGIETEKLDAENYPQLGAAFNIAHQLAQETMFMNDEESARGETPERRWQRIRDWAASNVRP